VGSICMRSSSSTITILNLSQLLFHLSEISLTIVVGDVDS
jgi:hypothetical protein